MKKLPRWHLAMQKSEQKDNTYQIYLYDDISEYGEFNWWTWTYDKSETSAKYIQKALEQVPEDGKIELYINSNGGSVKEGVAIYNQLKRHPAQKTGYVDGVAHSVAFVILQACDKRVMGEGTSALIHEMWVCTCGNADQLREEADQLDTLMESNRALFMQRAKGITENDLIAMMKKETILTPDAALQYGFIDEISGRAEGEGKPKKEEPDADIGELKEKLRGQPFGADLEEFARLTNPKKGRPEAKEQEDTSVMDVFFNIF